MEPRPKINIELSTADKAFELIGWLMLVALWALVLFNYSNLPGTVPTHFNASGEVDGTGDKATIFILPVLGTVLFVILTLIARSPQVFNYPTGITTENAKSQYINATRLIRYLKLLNLIIFFVIVFKTLQTAAGKADGLGPWFLPITLTLSIIPVIFFITRAVRGTAKKTNET